MAIELTAPRATFEVIPYRSESEELLAAQSSSFLGAPFQSQDSARNLLR